MTEHVGSIAGYMKHRRAKEAACPNCKRAWADYYRARRNRKTHQPE